MWLQPQSHVYDIYKRDQSAIIFSIEGAYLYKLQERQVSTIGKQNMGKEHLE